MLKDSHPRLLPHPHQQVGDSLGWSWPQHCGHLLLKLESAEEGLDSLQGTGHFHSESVGFQCSLRTGILTNPRW